LIAPAPFIFSPVSYVLANTPCPTRFFLALCRVCTNPFRGRSSCSPRPSRACPSPLRGRAAPPPGVFTPVRGPRLAARANGPGSGPLFCFDPASCGVRVARLGTLRRPPTAGRNHYRGRGGRRDGGRSPSLLLRIPGRVPGSVSPNLLLSPTSRGVRVAWHAVTQPSFGAGWGTCSVAAGLLYYISCTTRLVRFWQNFFS
jgi:hypothetical protein